MERKKIIQVIQYGGNIELLKFRIKEQDYIDTFIILENIYDDQGKPKNLLLGDKLLTEIEDKVIYLNYGYSVFSEKDLITNMCQVLTNKLLSYCTNFEDIIIFSSDEEFIDYNNFEKIKDELETSWVSLNHRQFWWGKNYFSPIDKKGSSVFTFSQLLVDKKLMQHMVETQNLSSIFSTSSITNGWKFNMFNCKDSTHKKNLTPYNEPDIRLVKFENQFEIPKNFNDLPSHEHNISNKILIVLDGDNPVDGYDKIAYVKFSKTINEVFGRTVDGKEYWYELTLPDRPLYGENYDDFISKYKENEIKRVINSLVLSDKDIVVK